MPFASTDGRRRDATDHASGAADPFTRRFSVLIGQGLIGQGLIGQV
jgi:hypothetical protein